MVPRSVSRWAIKALQRISSTSSSSWNWYGPIRESFTGAWQKNVVADPPANLLRQSAVYACVTGISADISKMRIKLSENEGGIWKEIESGSPWLPVLRRPNHYQDRIKFLEQWILSKLLAGNAYILKERDNRGVVSALYILDPRRTWPLVAENGDVYYEIKKDPLSRQTEDRLAVPAREIIHDRMACLFHPLVGIPPMYAIALSATMANKIQDSSTVFFNNQSLPGGMLTSEQNIPEEVAVRLKRDFEEKYSGVNIGRLLVAGSGLKFEPIQMTAEHAQLAEQLKMSVEDIARAFHYPLFKLGGPLPPYAGNVEALIMSYYTDCLQVLIESLELSLDEGLELPKGMGTELDLDNLMRMDTAALYDANNKAVGGGWMAPDEARFKANLAKVKGGDTPYLQQQNYSLGALAKRDAQEDPFAAKTSAPTTEPPSPPKAIVAHNEEDEELLGYARARKELLSA